MKKIHHVSIVEKQKKRKTISPLIFFFFLNALLSLHYNQQEDGKYIERNIIGIENCFQECCREASSTPESTPVNPHDCSSQSSQFKAPLRSQKLRCCKSIVHSVLVKRSKSSSEKSTGLSRELCRLGDRQASAANNVRSGSAAVAEEAAEGMEESR